MLRYAIPVVLLGTAALFVGASPAAPETKAPAAAANTIVNEPMVIYSITGGTLTGGVHRQLTVYNNGFVTISKFDTPQFPVQQVIKDVQTANVGANGALNLLLSMAQNGAVSLPDQQLFISDVPLKTLTILEGKELALSRTISWWGGGFYTGLQTELDNFIQQTFPGF